MENNNEEKWIKLPKYPTCFVCGQDNPAGLKLTFWARGREARTEWTPEMKFCGYDGIVHGGVVATVLDEIMGWAGWLEYRKYYFTMKIEIRYRKPVYANTNYRVESHLTVCRDKIYLAEGEIISPEGETVASGKATYMLRDRIE